MTITATVTDEFGQPAPSAQVYWVQEGPMEFTYFETETDQYGVAIARIIGYDDGEATITGSSPRCLQQRRGGLPGGGPGNCGRLH